METVDVLRGARTLLAEREGWRKNGFAGMTDGNICALMSEEAVCFCLAGALYRVMGVRPPENGRAIEDAVRAMGFVYRQRLIWWNDDPERTHADVLERLDNAIAKLEASNGNG